MQLDVHLDLNVESLVIMTAVLLLFGLAYNAVVGWLEENGRDEGYTAILVVVGVLVTVLVATPLIGIDSSIILLVGFIASGSPMIAGSIYRHVLARESHQEEVKRTIVQLSTREQSDASSTRLAE